MSRQPLPMTVGDVSAFARSLRRQLEELERLPGHVELLNCIARAGGWRNFQHLRAQADGLGAMPAGSLAAAHAPLEAADAETAVPGAPSPTDSLPEASGARISAADAPLSETDLKRVKRSARLFDGRGRLTTWPKKHSQRLLCLWGLWSQLPANSTFNEREISDWLEERHDFGDYALLRRFMVDLGLVDRTPDGRTYRRVEAAPPAEALEMIRAIGH